MKNNELEVFNFNGFKLETILDEYKEVWFLASPLAKYLDYKNPSEAIRTNVDEDEVAKIYIPIKSNSYIFINESGLYSLILRSNKPEAKAFKSWVTKEVLPTIRKTGGYILNKQPQTYLEAIEALVVKEKERLALEEKINNSTLFSNKEYSEGEKAYKKDIKEMYPFLDNGKINNILEFYTTKKYKDSVYYIKDEIEECMKKFFRDCKYRISDSRISVIATHECLLNSKCVISKEYAIEYLNFLEEEFDL